MTHKKVQQIAVSVLGLVASVPVLAQAQFSSSQTSAPAGGGGVAYDFASLVGLFISMIKTLVPLIVGLTLLYFIWGIFQLVSSNSEDSRKEAIGYITYGIVALFVMVSVWGLVSILTSTFFGTSLVIPQLH